MKSDTLVDYALLQLTPKRSHCDLIISRNGDVEKIFSGLVKLFASHLKGAEDKLAASAQSIEFKVDKCAKEGTPWFTKRTVERFVRFVDSPDILEQINTYDAEMSQLEAALKIYTEGLGDLSKNGSGYDGAGAKTAADATKRELIRAIDLRLVAVKQDMTSACLRAEAAGFDPDTISDLQFFARQFGSSRLKETCKNLTTLWQRRPDLVKQIWLKKKTTATADDRAVRSSTYSDMSIEEDAKLEHQDNSPNPSSGPHHVVLLRRQETEQNGNNVSSTSSSSSSSTLSTGPASIQASQPSRRLSVQDRINLFENKQKETSGGKLASPALEKTVLRRLSSDVSASTDKAVLRRWSGVSDMSVSIDLGSDNKSLESPVCTPSSSQISVDKFPKESGASIYSESVEKKDRDSESVSEDQMRSKKEQFELRRQESFQVRQTVSSEDVLKATFVDAKVVQETSKDMVSGREEGTRFESKVGDFQSKIRDSVVLHSNSNPVAQRLESNSEFPVASWKDVKREASSPPRHASFGEQVEVIEKRVVVPTAKLSRGVEDSESDARRIIFPDEALARDHAEKKHSRKTSLISKQVMEAQEVLASSASTSLDHVQRVRQSKGNQELNEELQLKANELEKLFAEHKLNVPGGDQSASVRRNKPPETRAEHAANSRHKNIEPPSATVPKTSHLVDSVGSSNTNMKSNSSSSFPGKAFKDLPDVAELDSSKGMAYIKYMQKRDAKLREEWNINRAEKEAKMKAMLDSLERSSAEMKAKFSGSMDKNDARRHMDKFRSFNVRSSARREQPIDDFENEEVDEESDTREQKSYTGQKVTYEDLHDGLSRNNQNKKLNRNVSSSTPRTPGLPVPRSAVKANNLVSGKRKTQPESPLAQSVPNFADFRNENSKPSGTTTAKTTPRSQPRNFARSRSSVEGAAAKEEKSRSQSQRKSYGNPVDSKDLSALNSDIDVLGSNKLSNRSESKTFLRKGNGIGPGAGAHLAKIKASTASDVLKIEEESCDAVSENEDYAEMIKEEEAEEFDAETEEYNDAESEQGMVKQENGNFSDRESRNDESVAELPVNEPAIFQAVGSVQESPSESPLSWNARMNQSFSYPRESSDVEALVDSPMGSPASWNSHSMTQSEAEAVRMRKKWGSAHKPFVPNSSLGQSRSKDMTKGFKRLLKFGRKSRGTETLVDWISATTSEGDDDTEDGRDPASRSSDDLRKSRMGFTSHPSDEAYTESELYSDQAPNFKFMDDHLSGSSLKAPRSFFSLSSFRSNKGCESKLR